MPDSMAFRIWGQCRWCGQRIVKGDGTLDTRRLWHPACASYHRLLTHPRELRRALRKRDKKVCAWPDCGKKCNSTNEPWEADHIVPLFLSEGRHAWFELGNVQTLCFDHHKEKTAQDMEKFRKHRRGEMIIVLSGQESDLVLLGTHLRIVYHEGAGDFPERLRVDLEKFQPYLKNAR